ncbi:alpha/beta fold hydrolase [Leifsonia sp. C5G2]|uniref:alpha/beta fold hydrolase n=1 Tax=Leifsonia sp. C5G2 TaxID=2735269 RepID=UPI001585B931|nr:alpha/beta fold hydrolase [Leifsonia sp. C5G2]NUU07624.1 alpha/beta fold hydrolase [Leifsonia sp. C5G2]
MPTTTLALHSTPAVAGAPARGPVLLLHGFAASAREDYLTTGWPQALAAAGHEVHAVDLPGHGDSPAVAGSAATTSAVVAALAAVVDDLGADVDVIGYSLGARLAWELPAATGRVRRLVLGGLSPFEPFATVDTCAVARAAAGDGRPADPLVAMMATMIAAPGRDTDSLLALMAGLAAEPFDPALGAPRVPTLVVAGADDVMTQGLDALAAGLPDGRFLRVPGDHRGALDSEAFRAAAIAFLGGRPGDAAM